MENKENLPSNHFSAPIVALSGDDVGAVAVVAREQHEIQAAIIAAKKFPRNEHQAYEKIIKSMGRPSMAEASTYNFPRGKKKNKDGQWVENIISGPSVDIAREAARCWGNFRYGVRIVKETEEKVQIKGYGLDLETNAYAEFEDEFAKKVQRKVWKDGESSTQWVTPDERDLRELINKRGALLERNCILKLIPSDIIDDAIAEAAKTLLKASKNELGANRDDAIKKLVTWFGGFGVNVLMIEEKLGHALTLINETEMTELRAIGKSIKDGNSQVSEHFGEKKEPTIKSKGDK